MAVRCGTRQHTYLLSRGLRIARCSLHQHQDLITVVRWMSFHRDERINRDPHQGGSRQGRGPYAQSKLPPDIYAGDFDEFPVGLPVVPCGLQTCCCCANAGKFETISSREEPSGGFCPCFGSRTTNTRYPADSEKANLRGPVVLGRRGTRVCLMMALAPVVLPCRACRQHRRLTDLYPVESTQKRTGLCGLLKAAVFFPCMLAKHVAFLRERQRAGELRYPWQTREEWTVAGRPPSAQFKILILGDHGVGKTALSGALCGRGFVHEYKPDTAVTVVVRTYSRENYPPAVLEIWDVPASSKADIGPELVAETNCALLVFDLDDRKSFGVAKQWYSTIAAASSQKGRPSPAFIMVGTKIDISPASKCAFLKGAKEWCDSKGSPLLFCTSFTGEGIIALLRQVVVLCFERHPPPAALKMPYALA